MGLDEPAMPCTYGSCTARATLPLGISKTGSASGGHDHHRALVATVAAVRTCAAPLVVMPLRSADQGRLVPTEDGSAMR